MKEKLEVYFENKGLEDKLNDEKFWQYEDKPDATRNCSGKVINRLINQESDEEGDRFLVQIA